MLCSARVVDRSCRSPLVALEGAGRGLELLRVQRPEGNFRMATIHQGIPRGDDIYLVQDAGSDAPVGVIHKPWLRGVWRDRWILRDAAWWGAWRSRRLTRAMVRTFLLPGLPRRYDLAAAGRAAGTVRASWDLGRLSIRADLRRDAACSVDRRLAVALLLVLLTR